MAKPKNRRALRSFIGMIHYYRGTWKRRSVLLALLTALTSNSVLWIWNKRHQQAFDAIKNYITQNAFVLSKFQWAVWHTHGRQRPTIRRCHQPKRQANWFLQHKTKPRTNVLHNNRNISFSHCWNNQIIQKYSPWAKNKVYTDHKN